MGEGFTPNNHAELEQAVKMPVGMPVGELFDVVGVGGAIISADDRVFRHLATGFGAEIEIERTYLMFLNYQAAPNCFRIVKIWEMRIGIAVATANDDIARKKSGISTVDGLNTTSLLSRITSLIQSN